MEITIGNKKLEHYQSVTISLKYDSVASSFSFSVNFDPDNADHREMFRPDKFERVVITHNNKTVITGTLLTSDFTSSPVDELLPISGYSITGVLEDCEIPIEAYPLQGDNINLKEKTEKILKAFGLKLVVDPAVSNKIKGNYKNTTGGDSQKCKAYISELASQKNVLVTHDEKGNLVLTEAKANSMPVFDFTTGMPGVKMRLSFDGQKMHSKILMQKQANKKRGTDKVKADTVNPYCKVFRPRNIKQSSGNDTNTALAARAALSEELRGIPVIIDLEGWELNGELVRPNTVVSIMDPKLYLYKKTNFFIESVDLKGGNGVDETATLTCVLPEVYNNQTPKNIFD